jgi:hypothetical protein
MADRPCPRPACLASWWPLDTFGGVADRVQLGARLRGIALDVAGRLRDARARRTYGRIMQDRP